MDSSAIATMHRLPSLTPQEACSFLRNAMFAPVGLSKGCLVAAKMPAPAELKLCSLEHNASSCSLIQKTLGAPLSWIDIQQPGSFITCELIQRRDALVFYSRGIPTVIEEDGVQPHGPLFYMNHANAITYEANGLQWVYYIDSKKRKSFPKGATLRSCAADGSLLVEFQGRLTHQLDVDTTAISSIALNRPTCADAAISPKNGSIAVLYGDGTLHCIFPNQKTDSAIRLDLAESRLARIIGFYDDQNLYVVCADRIVHVVIDRNQKLRQGQVVFADQLVK